MMNVPKDPGAGVGKSGVKTPWENGDRKNAAWTNDSLGTKGWEDAPRKNPAGGGREWDKPYETKNSNDGTDQNQSY